MDSSILFEAEACGDMGDMPMDCCHDETDRFELQDEFQSTQISIDVSPSFEIIELNVLRYTQALLNLEKQTNSFIDPPSPPLITGDIYMRVQSFLI
jgi:hypothetical protein